MLSRTVPDLLSTTSCPLLMRAPTRLFAALFAVLIAALLAAAAVLPAQGQPSGHPLGVGAHIGEPVGLSIKFYDRPGAAYDLLAAFDLPDDDLFFSAHRVWERPLPSAGQVRLFHGPGLFASTAPANDVAVGLGYTGGLSLPFDRLEASLQLTPRLRVLPGTDFALGGGLGLRYYFSL
jgi:hypothetical protein